MYSSDSFLSSVFVFRASSWLVCSVSDNLSNWDLSDLDDRSCSWDSVKVWAVSL